MGLYLEMLGVLAAILAFSTGYFLTGDVLDGAGHLGKQHELFAVLTLVTIILAAFFRFSIVYLKKENTFLKYLAMGFFFLAVVFIGITGFYGGMIVFGNV